jgi:mannose-6-phosphate isomerase-like protein (cupin superfamily)
MKPKIIKANQLNEDYTPERCFVGENYSKKSVSIARARVKPGITTVPHHLKGVEEIYLITKGNGKVNIAGLKPTKVSAGDLVIIPPETSQSITNAGKTDLVFYCICTPRFTYDCYEGEVEEKLV